MQNYLCAHAVSRAPVDKPMNQHWVQVLNPDAVKDPPRRFNKQINHYFGRPNM